MPGNSATTRSPSVTRYTGSAITSPITAAREIPLRENRRAPRPRDRACATTSIRSCDSLSRISYGVMPSSRTGTLVVSIVTPTSPRAAISADDDVSPAAPMSWMATMCAAADQLEARLEQQLLGERIADLHARPLGVARRGEVLRRERRAVNAVASRARADGDDRIADALRRRRESARPRAGAPTHIALTSGLPSYDGIEYDLAGDGRNADAVAVVADALHARRRTGSARAASRASRSAAS